MVGKTGLCRYCKKYTMWCSDNHHCDSGNGFAPFAPKDVLNFDRETIILKWLKYVEETND